MQHMVRLHGAHQADVVGERTHLPDELGYLEAALAVRLELETGTDHRKRSLLFGDACDALALADRVGKFFAAAFVEQRFFIEEVVLREAAGRKDHDDPRGSGAPELVGRGVLAGGKWRLSAS